MATSRDGDLQDRAGKRRYRPVDIVPPRSRFPAMPSLSVFTPVQRLWAHDKFAYGVRVLLALSGAMAACWATGSIAHVIPLFLGVIAGALAETDDDWRGRVGSSLVTLGLFFATACTVKAVTPYPPLFIVGMVGSTFCLTMAASLGDRYRAIGQATLVLGVYTMLGLEQDSSPEVFWLQPALLTVGAAWYCLLSVFWQAMFSDYPVRQGLAGLFLAVGDYLEGKSQLFVPTRRTDRDALRVTLAQRNGRVVIALNQVRDLIRRRKAHGGAELERFLRLFFLAQDIHERASSSHYPYETFVEAFFHSDVMFRCQHLLFQQGRACRTLANALRQREPFRYAESTLALADLRESLTFLRQQVPPPPPGPLRSLGHLVTNLETLGAQLARANDPKAEISGHDDSLFDDTPRSLHEAHARVVRNLTPRSPIFRHALRLTLALGAGYAIKSFINPAFGFWILLTTLFVCQPSYASTRQRMLERFAGTVLGLIAGWALITLFPAAAIQRLIAVAAGVAFFIWRSNRYVLATGAITLMVVCMFNQVVDSYGIIWPRLIDTVVGGLLSGLAVIVVLPDWQGRQLHKVVAATLSANSRYLAEILRQYTTGKADDLSYRLVRRAAHAADAALSSALSNMLQEPERYRIQAERCMRILVASHTMLGYLSALGAHRDSPTADPGPEISQAAHYIATTLDALAEDLTQQRPLRGDSYTDEAMAAALENIPDDTDDRQRLLRTEIALICRQLPVIRQQAETLPGRDTIESHGPVKG